MMKKRILSFILLILILIPLLLSCGGEMPEKTPEPITPEAQTPEAVTPEESYPKDVSCEYGLINPPIVELCENNQYVEIIRDRETVESYRAKYDALLMNDYRIYWQYPFNEYLLTQLFSAHENAVKAFALCEDESFFDHNILILLGIPHSDRKFSSVEAKIVQDKTGKENLEICINRKNGPITFSDGEKFTDVVLVSVSKDIGIQSEQDITIQYQII